MRILAFTKQSEVIEKILTHLPACAKGKQGALVRTGPPPTRLH